MTGLSLCSRSPAGEPVCCPARAAGVLRAAALATAIVGVVVAACGVRLIGLDAPFESSDQAEMPRAVLYGLDLRGIATHAYGPMIAGFSRLSAIVAGLLHVPLTEAAFRWPVALVGLLQIPLTWALAGRLGLKGIEALTAAAFCAFLPTMVADARCTWAWGYLTLWVFLGTVALWSTLAWFESRRHVHLLTAAAALAGHLLSNCFSAGLPAALLVAWWRSLRGADPRDGRPAPRSRVWHFVGGFLVPCLLASSVVTLIWVRTGGGPLARLLFKHQSGVFGLSWSKPVELAAIWTSQVGHLFAVLIAAVLAAALTGIVRGGHLSLPAVWALAGLMPLLAADYNRIGYPGAYFIEVLYAAGLAAIAGAFHLRRRWPRRTPARVGVALLLAAAMAQMAAGSLDDHLGRGKLSRWTGVACGWGNTDRDSGIKAAGWYIRTHVPPDAVVLCLHTNRGMEAPVAEFYCGRTVLAGRDTPEPLLGEVLATFSPRSDVIVAEARHEHLLTARQDFEPVAVFERAGRRVRAVYARRDLQLEHVTAATEAVNRLYDARYAPRRVPVPLETDPQREAVLRDYRITLKTLKRGLAGKGPALKNRGAP